MKSIRIIFFGTPEFAATGLKALLLDARYNVALVVSQPDRPAGRGGQLSAPPVKKLAELHKIPVIQPLNIRKNEESFLKEVAQHGPFDLGVVIAFGQILPQSTLNIPKMGCVNVHGSLLPRWRGAAPIQRAIMAGDPETGICLMKMEAGLDTGPVYATEKLTIGEDETFGALHDRLSVLGGAMLVEHLQKIASGALTSVSQPIEGVTYAQKIAGSEALIDWSKPAAEVSRTIRGLSPSPGAYTTIGGKRLKLYKSMGSTVPANGTSAAVGSVLKIDDSCITIQCGKDAVRVTELQLEGKKRLSASEFAKGGQIEVGSILV